MNSKAIRVVLFAWILVLCLVISFPVRAQVAGATLTGTINDAQGGTIPSAKVSVRNLGTGISVETTTNDAGLYSVPNLVPADYEVSVSASGFSTTLSKVTLTVGSKQVMNLTLTVGQISQQVEVTGVAPQVELESSTISGNVQGSEIRELPLNGRDWASLATLEPGVASVRTQSDLTHVGGGSRGLGMQLSVGGARPQQNSYRLDGGLLNDYSNAGPGSVLGQQLGVDAIQEFSVLTSNYSAEYGFTAGGVINAVTRSGTNQLHGTAFDFLRNGKLDAANFFDNALGTPKSVLIQNQFGGSAGAPILRDKVFVFGDYEGVRQIKGKPHSDTTLSSAVLSSPCTGALVAPCSSVTNLSTGTATTVSVDPIIAKYLALYHPPTGPLTNSNVGQYNWQGTQNATENFYTFRGDYRISGKDGLSGTYVYDNSTLTFPQPMNVIRQFFLSRRQSIILQETHVFSASVVNTERVALNRTRIDGGHTLRGANPAGADPALAGIPTEAANPAHLYGSPSITLSGTTATAVAGLGAASQQDYSHQNLQVYDDAFFTHGNHTLKLGFSYFRMQNNAYNPLTVPGSGTFSNTGTNEAKADCTNPNTGKIDSSCGPLINFLTNQPLRAARPKDFSVITRHYFRTSVPAVYAQDDWRIRPSLTLNLGLRYETSSIPTEIKGQIADLPCLTCPATSLNNTFWTHNPTLKNFEPRVGFAWDPFHNGKTAVRGGWGLFDTLPLPYMLMLNNTQTAPFGNNFGNVGVAFGSPIPKGTWPYSIPGLAANPPATARTWDYVDANIKRNYVYQYNLNIQRQLTPNTTITVGYSGSRGIHNPMQFDTINSVIGKKTDVGYVWRVPWTYCPNPNSNPTPACPGPGAGFTAQVNPNVGGMMSTLWESQSWYNGLQVRVDKKMSHGFQVQGAFTWSKSIDDSSGSFAGDNFQLDYTSLPFYDQSLNKGLSDFDIRRNLVINALWNPPTPKSLTGFAGRALGGWQLGVIASLSDGVPFFPNMGSDGNDMLGEQNVTVNPPFVIPGACTSFVNVKNPNAYVNASCFGLVPQSAATIAAGCDVGRSLPGTCFNIRGDLGRNTIIGPGLVNTDFSVFKNNYVRKISESFNVQFRAEFFNVFNRANFSPPSFANLEVINSAGTKLIGSNGTFGRIIQTQTPSREIQFALKVVW